MGLFAMRLSSAAAILLKIRYFSWVGIQTLPLFLRMLSIVRQQIIFPILTNTCSCSIVFSVADRTKKRERTHPPKSVLSLIPQRTCLLGLILIIISAARSKSPLYSTCRHSVYQKLHQAEIQNYNRHSDKHRTRCKPGKFRVSQTHQTYRDCVEVFLFQQ